VFEAFFFSLVESALLFLHVFKSGSFVEGFDDVSVPPPSSVPVR